MIERLSPDTSTFLDPNCVEPDTWCAYRLYAAGCDATVEARAFTLPRLPDAAATAAGPGARIEVRWLDVNVFETAYQVRRQGPQGGAFEMIAQLDPNSVSYSDLSVSLDALYAYEVVAVNPSGETATQALPQWTLPPTPVGLAQAGSVRAYDVTLAWSNPNMTVTGYT
ncbi:MAG TPA: hypothetical protein VFH51_11665, partial [Myxococcota bacterium]|nr:hypothetical protein [Myxococcota bacterium]